MSTTQVAVVGHVVIVALTLIRVMLRPHREPAARVAWVAVIAALPVVGIATYLLFGEISIGRRQTERVRRIVGSLPNISTSSLEDQNNMRGEIPDRYAHLFRLGKSIGGFEPFAGNAATLMENSNEPSNVA